jgi:hypothetical protein
MSDQGLRSPIKTVARSWKTGPASTSARPFLSWPAQRRRVLGRPIFQVASPVSVATHTESSARQIEATSLPGTPSVLTIRCHLPVERWNTRSPPVLPTHTNCGSNARHVTEFVVLRMRRLDLFPIVGKTGTGRPHGQPNLAVPPYPARHNARDRTAFHRHQPRGPRSGRRQSSMFFLLR